MTKEEAIKKIESSDIFWVRATEEEAEALNMAIEVLNGHDPTKESDTVYRQAAIECLSHGEGCGHICKHRIESLPSADRAKGKWIFGDWLGKGAGYKCSECSRYYFRVDGMNYCPRCGAKMDVSHE